MRTEEKGREKKKEARSNPIPEKTATTEERKEERPTEVLWMCIKAPTISRSAVDTGR